MKPRSKASKKTVEQNLHDSITIENKIVDTLADITGLIKKQSEIDSLNIRKLNNAFAFTGVCLGIVLVISLRAELSAFASWVVWQVSTLFNQISPDAKWQSLIVAPLGFFAAWFIKPIIQKNRK